MFTRSLAMLSLFLLSAPAFAEKPVDESQCTSAFEEGQRERNAGHLLNAVEQFEICAAAECPTVIADKCNVWRAETEASVPSVSVAAVDHEGIAVSDVRIYEGDELLRDGLTGGPLRLDPGTYQLRFVRDGANEVERQVALGSGATRIEIQFAPVVPTPEPARAPDPTPVEPAPALALSTPPAADTVTNSISPLVPIGFSVAGAGFIAGAVAGGIALSRFADIEAECRSVCTEDRIAEGEIPAHVATVGLVVGGAGLVLGLAGLLLSDFDDANTSQLRLGPSGVVGSF